MTRPIQEGSRPTPAESPHERKHRFRWRAFTAALAIGCAPAALTVVLPVAADAADDMDTSTGLGFLWLYVVAFVLPVWALLLMTAGLVAVFLRRRPALCAGGWGAVLSAGLIAAAYAVVLIVNQN